MLTAPQKKKPTSLETGKKQLAAASLVEVGPRAYGWGCRVLGFRERESAMDLGFRGCRGAIAEEERV
jgi:hypothetical protein